MVISSAKMVPGYDLTHNPGNVAMRASADMAEFAIDAIASIEGTTHHGKEILLPTPWKCCQALENEILKIVLAHPAFLGVGRQTMVLNGCGRFAGSDPCGRFAGSGLRGVSLARAG